MELKTVIEPMFKKRKKKNLFLSLILLLNLIFTPFIPVACGFYYAISKNPLWLVAVIIISIFSVEIDAETEKVYLRIKRLF